MSNQYTSKDRQEASQHNQNMTSRLNQSEDRMEHIEAALAENRAIIEALTVAIAKNTEFTMSIAANTAPLIDLVTDVTAGTKFMCRLALGVRFLLIDVVKPFWAPALIIFSIGWMATHDALPLWITELIKVLHP